MGEPSRLLAEGGVFESALLGAWAERQPSDAARMRTLAAVGLGGVVGTASASIAPKALVASSSLLKWIMAGAAVLATAGSVGYVAFGSKTVIPAQVAVASSVAPPPHDTTPRGESSGTFVPGVEAAGTKAVTETARPMAPRAPSSSMSVPILPSTKETATARGSTSSLDDEVLVMDRARRALSSGDARGAIERVDAYDARYPNGALRQESAEIRIEALFREGDRVLGKKLADRFIAAYPSSPYTRVVRGLAEAAPAAAP